MNPETIACDISDLLSADKGYTVKKGFLLPGEADAYRVECEEFLANSTAVYKKIHRYSKHDYIWSEDGKVVPGVFTYRIYQSLASKHSGPTEEIFQRMLSLRDQIEGTWLDNEQYKRIRQDQFDYAQVTSYGQPSPGIAKHCDYQGKAPYPLLQCLIFLTRPGVDYTGGDLILYTKNGNRVDVQATLKLEKGDALLFDKSLFHEVEPTLTSKASEIGRWTAVVGARYPSPALKARTKRLLSRVASKVTQALPALRRFA